MKKILSTLLLGILLFNLVSAGIDLGVVKQNDCIKLYQSCPTCTYSNIRAIKYPNGSIDNLDLSMTKNNSDYTYEFCDTGDIGIYSYIVYGNKGGLSYESSEEGEFEVTPSGKISSTSEAILYLVLTIVFFGLFILMFYFAVSIPGGNPASMTNEYTKVNNFKYLKLTIITLIYPVILLLLNFMNGLAANFTTLTIFANILGFIFLAMAKLTWIWTLIMILIIAYWIIKDSNFKKMLRSMGNPLPGIG